MIVAVAASERRPSPPSLPPLPAASVCMCQRCGGEGRGRRDARVWVGHFRRWQGLWLWRLHSLASPLPSALPAALRACQQNCYDTRCAAYAGLGGTRPREGRGGGGGMVGGRLCLARPWAYLRFPAAPRFPPLILIDGRVCACGGRGFWWGALPSHDTQNHRA